MQPLNEYVKEAYNQVYSPGMTPGELALRAVELYQVDAAKESERVTQQHQEAVARAEQAEAERDAAQKSTLFQTDKRVEAEEKVSRYYTDLALARAELGEQEVQKLELVRELLKAQDGHTTRMLTPDLLFVRYQVQASACPDCGLAVLAGESRCLCGELLPPSAALPLVVEAAADPTVAVLSGQHYRHYKGAEYVVLCVAKKEADTTCLEVVYQNADLSGAPYTRPVTEFCPPRFVLLPGPRTSTLLAGDIIEGEPSFYDEDDAVDDGWYSDPDDANEAGAAPLPAEVADLAHYETYFGGPPVRGPRPLPPATKARLIAQMVDAAGQAAAQKGGRDA